MSFESTVGANNHQSVELDTAISRGLVSDLAEARVGLMEGSTRNISTEDERAFAASFIKSSIRQIQQTRLSAGKERLSDTRVAAIFENVIDTSFHGAQLWRIWSENPTASNLSVYGTNPARLENSDGSVSIIDAVARSDEQLRSAVRALRIKAGHADARWDPTSPELELIIEEDGTRITAVDFVTAHPFVTLRRPTLAKVTLQTLIDNDTISVEAANFLDACVAARLRILVAGSMNSGKTVTLRALASCLSDNDAVLVAESQAELRLEKHPDTYPNFVVPMTSRRANSEGKNAISVRDLITHIQRMSPTVVIVGEVRGAEATALAASLSQGYQVMSTIHANSAASAIRNAALYYQEETGTSFENALARISIGVDVVVHMALVPSANTPGTLRRVVNQIAFVADPNQGAEAGALVLEALFQHDGRRLTSSGYMPNTLAARLAMVGYNPRSDTEMVEPR